MANGGNRMYLDACCLINILATGRAEEILEDLPYTFTVAKYVSDNEVLQLRSAAGDREDIDLSPLTKMNLLAIADAQTAEELSELVGFAEFLDDGEAWTCALAVCNEGTVATDDRKAIRVLGERAPSTLVRQTPELLYDWADGRGLTEFELRKTLEGVKQRARFVPRRKVPRGDWWLRHLGS